MLNQLAIGSWVRWSYVHVPMPTPFDVTFRFWRESTAPIRGCAQLAGQLAQAGQHLDFELKKVKVVEVVKVCFGISLTKLWKTRQNLF